MKALTTPATHPALHRWDSDPAARSWSAAQIVGHTRAVAAELAAGFRVVVADHVDCTAPVVLEGDYLTPVVQAWPFQDALARVESALRNST